MYNVRDRIQRRHFAYEKPSAIFIIFTWLTIIQGMLIAIAGLATGSKNPLGFMIAGFGLVLIVCQYASTYRRNLHCMCVATLQLLLLSLICGFLLLKGGCAAVFPFVISLVTAAFNTIWAVSLVEQRSIVPDNLESEQISLIEIFMAILIAALILGPASAFYR